MIFTDNRQLADAVSSGLGKPAIIGVDGWTGSGKTTLAESLADQTGGRAFDLDSALVPDQQAYVSAVRLDVVRSTLANPVGLTFVSGICLRQVFDLAGVAAAAHIYVKRMTTWGWIDELDLESDICEVPGSSGERVRRELQAYHRDWLPQLKADYEFWRHD